MDKIVDVVLSYYASKEYITFLHVTIKQELC